MEEDRAKADLGEAVDAELASDQQNVPKQPRRRFIGRKAAAERAEQKGTLAGAIENNGAIQGMMIQLAR